jgi:hypothetical protein
MHRQSDAENDCREPLILNCGITSKLHARTPLRRRLLHLCGWKHLAIIALFLTSDNSFNPDESRHTLTVHILLMQSESGKAEKAERFL